MCLLLESIRYENGQFQNLDLHTRRMEFAARHVLNQKLEFDLCTEITIPANLKSNRYKCRIVYNTQIQSTEYIQYKRKIINSLKLIEDNEISYAHKFENRDCINKHSTQLKQNEEMVIVKNGLLTDASYSNIALYTGSEWHTPAQPLLLGTKRQQLIEADELIPKKITPSDLKNYQKVSFINALNDLDELVLVL